MTCCNYSVNNLTMTNEQEEDPLNYVPTLFWTPEDEPFPFFELPVVVQWKILREYLPILTKARALGRLPEFSRLLHARSSWTNVSEEFSQIVPILSTLREGLYVPSNEDLPDMGYYVTMGASGLTFSMCCIGYVMFRMHYREFYQFSVLTAASNLRDFLKCFLKRYQPVEKNPILVYRINNGQIFFIDPTANVVMWADDSRHKIKHNECTIAEPFFNFFSFSVTNGIHFILENKNWVSLQYCDRKLLIEPTLLESRVLYVDDVELDLQIFTKEEGLLTIGRKLCQFEISLEGRKEISVHVSTPSPGLCRWCNDHELFNILSKSIVFPDEWNALI